VTAERDENVCRLDFTPSEAVALAGRLEALERPKAKERQGKRTDLQHSGKLPESSKGDNRCSTAASCSCRWAIKFLKQIDADTPPELDLHLIVDNYATHKHPKVLAWLARHPRFHVHFTPTSSSWLNLIERWFRDLTQRRLKRGVFRSVAELQRAIEEYVTHHNADPQPFIWTKSASQILNKVARARKALHS